MIYSVNVLRNFQRRNWCKEIKENSQHIARPYREVIISVVIGSIGPPTLSGLDSSKGTGPDAINLQVVRFPWWWFGWTYVESVHQFDSNCGDTYPLSLRHYFSSPALVPTPSLKSSYYSRKQRALYTEGFLDLIAQKESAMMSLAYRWYRLPGGLAEPST